MNYELLERAARAVQAASDWDASFYTAQSAVEDWALDALAAVLAGNDAEAVRLLNTYENAEWEGARAIYPEPPLPDYDPDHVCVCEHYRDMHALDGECSQFTMGGRARCSCPGFEAAA